MTTDRRPTAPAAADLTSEPTAVASAEPLDEVLQRAVDEAARLLRADGALIVLRDETTGMLGLAYGTGTVRKHARAWSGALRLPDEGGLIASAMAERRVRWTDDYLADTSFIKVASAPRMVRRLGIRSFAVAPLIVGDEPIGALGVHADREAAFDEAQLALVKALADHAAASVANARLIDQLDRSRESLARRAAAEHTLREIAARLAGMREPRGILQYAVDEARRLVDADGARIDAGDLETEVLRFEFGEIVSGEISPTRFEPGEVRRGQGVAGRAIVTGRPFWTGDYLDDRSFDHAPAQDAFARRTGMRSVFSAPLPGADRPIGALSVLSRRQDAFDDEAKAVIAALADHAAIAIANARLIEELRGSQDEVERRARSEQALREVAARLTAVRDPGELLQLVVDEASRLVAADGAILALLDRERGVLGWDYDDGLQQKFDPAYVRQLTLKIGAGVSGRAVAERRVIAVARALLDDFPLEPESRHFFEVTGFQSMIAAPIVGEDGPLGALEMYWTSVDAFDDQDVELIEAFANQAAIAITNTRLIDQLAQSRQEVERRAAAERALREIGARLTAIRDPADVLQQAVDAAARLLDADGALLDLLDPESGIIRWAYDSGISDEAAREILRDLEIPVGSGLFGRAIAERRVVMSGDYARDDRFSHLPGADRFSSVVGLRSLVAAPLIGEGGPLGVLGVYSGRPNAFDEADLALLGAFADQATVAITNSRLIDELARSRVEVARRAESERTLRQIAARITALRDPAEVLQQVVDESKRLLASDGAHLTLMSDDRTFVYPVVVAGGTDDATRDWLKTQEFPIGAGMNGLAAERSEPIWTADYLVDPRIPHEQDDQTVARRMGLRGMAVAPLRAVGGETLGTLAVSYERPRDVSADEIELLQGLADQAAIAVTNLQLYERLAQSEARYRFLVQNAPDVVWSFDEAGRWTFVSPAVERFGWTIEQLLGQPFWELIHEDHRDELVARWQDAVATGSSETQRFRSALRTPSGTPIAVEIVANPILEDGRLAGGYGVTHDIREQDRLERELRDSEARYRSLVQSSPDLIWAADRDGALTFVSDRSSEFFGLRPEDLVGQHWSSVVHPDTRAETRQRVRELVLAEPTVPSTVRLVLLGPGGRPIPAEMITIGRLGEDGQVVGALGSVRDVTEQARLESELRDSESRYRFLVQSSPDLIWAADLMGRFTFLSDRSSVLFGLAPDELLGSHWSRVVHPDSLEEANRRWAGVLADPAQSQHVRLTLLGPGGRPVSAELSAVARVDGAGQVVGALGSVRDITEQARLERELRESESRYRTLVQTSPDVVWVVGADGTFTYMSDRVEELTGWRPDELIGEPWAVIVAPDRFALATEEWQALANDPELILRVPLTLRHRDGSDVATEVSAVSLWVDDTFGGAHGSIRDVRERERLLRELRDSESRFRYLVETSPDLIWQVDAGGRFTFLSDTADAILAWAPAELLGSHFSTVIADRSIAVAQENWAALTSTPGIVRSPDTWVKRRDGSEFPTEIIAVSSWDDGRFTGAHGSVRDITERDRLERDLRQQAAELAASDERAHLARELHDSVTQGLFSMTLLTRSIELLLERDPAAAAEKLTILRELQKDALAETRALIFELRPSSLDQDGLVKALRTHVTAVQGRIGLPVVVEADDVGRLPHEIEDALYRIAQEGLHNVVKHANARRVTIRLESRPPHVRLVVKDDGAGFDAAAVPGGHLGLAGMRARAEKVGGTLNVTSRRGRGTTIEAVVPVVPLVADVPVAPVVTDIPVAARRHDGAESAK